MSLRSGVNERVDGGKGNEKFAGELAGIAIKVAYGVRYPKSS